MVPVFITKFHNMKLSFPPQTLSQLVNADRATSVIISSINGQIKEADSSNFTVWSDFIDKRMCDALNRPYYLHGRSMNTAYEKVARSIFLTSVNQSLRRTLGRMDTVHDVWNDLRHRFHSVSRAAQLDLIRRLISFDISAHPSTSAVATHLNNILDEMELCHLDFSQDCIAGLALQVGLSSNATLATEFNWSIEALINPGRPNNSIPFDMLVRQVNIICRQQAFDNDPLALPCQNPPVILQADTAIGQNTSLANVTPFPVPDNTPDAVELLAMQVGQFWQCCGTNHLLRNCLF
jgi:hypothetical protein